MHVLHVDDDPFMRDVVDLALGSDPQFVVMSCSGGEEALAVVPGWAPDLIILDVMMPDMDGPAVLARLRENPETTKIPIILITARASAEERERLLALGAIAVIGKPFYPAKLAETVRRHMLSIKLASSGFDFSQRLRQDGATLASFRDKLGGGANPAPVLEDLQSVAHKLAGAAGVFNFQAVSRAAAALEDAIIEGRAGRGASGAIQSNLDTLLSSIEHA